MRTSDIHTPNVPTAHTRVATHTSPTSATRSGKLRLPVSTNALGVVAIVGAVVWIATVAAFHLIRSDLTPGDAYISNYARGDWAWVMRAAFLINAAGWAAAGIGIRRELSTLRGAATLTVLTSLAALGMFVAGIFRADPLHTQAHSVEGIIHGRAAGLAFIALILFGFVGWAVVRRADAWAAWARPSLAFGVAALILFVAFNAWPHVVGDGFGWWQRALAAVLIPGWLWLIGTRLTTRGCINRYRTAYRR